jgi:hypothetical protein
MRESDWSSDVCSSDLVFVGLKMVWLNEAFGGKFPIAWSLGIIGGVIAVSVGWSLLLTRGGSKSIEKKETGQENEMVMEDR